MDNLVKKGQPDRSRINLSENYEVKYWTKHLGVSREDLVKAVEKVGNSASAVRKELGLTRASR
jgi:3-oxoacyl-[acyl-carrier-protein] synthase III